MTPAAVVTERYSPEFVSVFGTGRGGGHPAIAPTAEPAFIPRALHNVSLEDGQALVQVIPPPGQALGAFVTGTSRWGEWMRGDFEVLTGPEQGKAATMMLNLKADDLRLAATLAKVMGYLPTGAFDLRLFNQKLAANIFKAELEHGTIGQTGAPSGILKISSLLEPVGPR